MPEISLADLTRLHDDKQVHVHQNLDEFRAWLNLLRPTEPQVYLEIGAFRLGSAQLALESLPTLELLVTIDTTDLRQDPVLEQKLHEYEDRLRFVHGHSASPATFGIVERLVAGRRVDALFIDGDHSYNGVLQDYCRYSPLVKPGRGHVGFHDVRMENMPEGASDVGHLGTQSFWEGLSTNYPSRCQLLEADPGPWGNYGIGVYRVVRPGNR